MPPAPSVSSGASHVGNFAKHDQQRQIAQVRDEAAYLPTPRPAPGVPHRVDDPSRHPEPPAARGGIGMEEAADEHLEHDDGVRLERVLMAALDGIELLLEFVRLRGVQVRIPDVVFFAGKDHLDRLEEVHEKRGGKHGEGVAVSLGKGGKNFVAHGGRRPGVGRKWRLVLVVVLCRFDP
mmetsp:Transcript_22787/g.52224  ORF Transcript_22787/g.52224 Transcript_22787/m.52224 type:complete len:179 (-) Transcript_22787:88-624(-)